MKRKGVSVVHEISHELQMVGNGREWENGCFGSSDFFFFLRKFVPVCPLWY